MPDKAPVAVQIVAVILGTVITTFLVLTEINRWIRIITRRRNK